MDNLILIGMPASGKSTIGKLLADMSGRVFLDGDDLICRATGEELSATIARVGASGFIPIEEHVLCAIHASHAVIATGGSAVYSARAMAHLKEKGIAVYLKTPFAEIAARIPDFAARGVVMRGRVSTLQELDAERTPLYEKYADITVDCAGKSPVQIAEELLNV